jgi:hypothetical protein
LNKEIGLETKTEVEVKTEVIKNKIEVVVAKTTNNENNINRRKEKISTKI